MILASGSTIGPSRVFRRSSEKYAVTLPTAVMSPVTAKEPDIIALPLTSNLALIGVVFPIATFPLVLMNMTFDALDCIIVPIPDCPPKYIAAPNVPILPVPDEFVKYANAVVLSVSMSRRLALPVEDAMSNAYVPDPVMNVSPPTSNLALTGVVFPIDVFPFASMAKEAVPPPYMVVAIPACPPSTIVAPLTPAQPVPKVLIQAILAADVVLL